MFGAVIKTYFAQKKGIAPENITCVSIMPCMSKKRELTLPGMDSAGTGQDIDYVLTTREICRLIKAITSMYPDFRSATLTILSAKQPEPVLSSVPAAAYWRQLFVPLTTP